MGGGYSGNFAGTEGAVGDRQVHQISFSDVVPVRTKSSGVMVGVAGGGSATIKMKQCFCCRERTIPAGTVYEVCPICGWIDDKHQNKNPDSLDGRNLTSLNDARELFKNKARNV